MDLIIRESAARVRPYSPNSASITQFLQGLADQARWCLALALRLPLQCRLEFCRDSAYEPVLQSGTSFHATTYYEGMGHLIRSQTMGLLRASHFGPTVLVVTITYVLSLTQFSSSESLFIALAILMGQFVVGWSNDLIDFSRDKAAMRTKKPLVAGTITEATLRIAIAIALLSALVVSLVSPLGVSGTTIHFLGLLSATAYNLKLKSTILSVVPYVVSFGALPWAIYVAAGARPPTWIVLGFIFISSAFHFLNVLKDMEADIAQGIMGLPQILGRKKSIVMAILLLTLGILDVLLGMLRN